MILRTVFHQASRNGHFDAVKYLLDLGANTAANDGDGSTSLYVSWYDNLAESC